MADTTMPDAIDALSANNDEAPITPPQAAASAPAPATGDDWGDGDKVAPTGPDFLKTLNPARAQLVQAIGEGRLPAPRVQGRNGSISPDAQALIADVAQAYPKFDAVDAPRRVAAGKAWTSGKLGQQAITIGTALEHAMTLETAIKGLGNVNSPIPLTTHLVNGVRNAAASANGDDPIVAYRAAAEPVLEEMSKAFHGGSSEGSVSRLGFTLPENGSPSQQRTAVQTYIKLLKGKLDELQGGYNKAIGTTGQGLPMISDEAKQNLGAFLDPNYIHNGIPVSSGGAGGGSDGGDPPSGGPAGGVPIPSGGPVAGRAAGDGMAPIIAPPTATLSADGSSDTITAKDQEYTAKANALFADPKSTRADFDALASQYGRAAYGSVLDDALKDRATGGKHYVLQPAVTHEGPSVAGAVANSALGSAAIGAADTGSFGLLPKAVGGVNALKDKLTGTDQRSLGDIYTNDLADAHASIDASEAAHPLAALGGQVGGFITGGAALGNAIRAIPGAAGVLSKVPAAFAPAANDALEGALYSGGSQDHLADVPGAVLKGGALAAAGGALGRGVVRGTAALASPVANAAVQRLTNAGVTLTPGQVLGTSGGLVGRFTKGIEDRLAGFPGVGDVINSTRRGGVEDFNKAAISDALTPIGEKAAGIGHDGIADMQQKASNAIGNALKPINAAPDAALSTDIAAATSGAAKLSEAHQGQFKNAIDTDVKPYLSGSLITGDNIKAIKEGLDAKISNLRGQGSSPQDRDLADAFDNVKESFLDFADRADPSASSDYAKARQAYAMTKRVEAAASKAKDGVFTPNQFRQAVTKRGYGTTTANVARGSAPMQQLATDASTVLPSTVPDSGTAGRAALGLIAGGGLAGGGEGYREGGATGALTGALAGAALLSRPGAKAFQYLAAGSREGAGARVAGATLLGLGGAGAGYAAGGVPGAIAGGAIGAKLGSRPQTLGDILRRNNALGGAIGAPALLANRGN